MRRATALAVTLAAIVAAPACKTDPKTPATGGAGQAAALPTPAQVRQVYNARTRQLGRVWARCVGTLITRDREGEKRTEQGEGHFQVLQPDRFALSLGKLGEVIVWLGCDEERYWVFMKGGEQGDECFVGRHDLLTPDKLARLGTPAVPLDLFLLTGLGPLPDDPRARVSWSRDGDSLIYETSLRGRALRYTLTGRDYLPTRIEFPEPVARDRGAPSVLHAELSEFETVPITGRLDGHPPIATVIRVIHPPSATSLQVTLNGMSDGVRPARLRDENFDFDALVRLLGVGMVTDLDAESSQGAEPAGKTGGTPEPSTEVAPRPEFAAPPQPAADEDEEPTRSTISEERDG